MPVKAFVVIALALLAACGPATAGQVFQATIAPTENSAPLFSPTPTFTATLPPTVTPSPTTTPSPTVTPSPAPTLTRTPSPTVTPSLTPTPSPSPTASRTPSPTLTPTVPLLTLTAVSSAGAPPAVEDAPAEFAPAAGWGCGDFPCETDIAGFLRRIRVPEGYALAHIGQFPGQPLQIVYGPDGRLYATVLENGTRSGAVYAMDDAGRAVRYSGDFVSPVGLAFQPGSAVLYVSARETLETGGGVWRIPPGGGAGEQVIHGLPCCFSVIDNQPNGMVFGPDGFLYLGVGSLSDHGEDPTPRDVYTEIVPMEASVLRIQPHTGDIEIFAEGIRNPYDLTFDSGGQFYATDQGMVTGQGDRLLAVDQGAHYGWPFWRSRECGLCPPTRFDIDVVPDLVTFAPHSVPRGLVAYTATQFPANRFDDLFVVLWNGIEGGQRVVRIDPDDPLFGTPDYEPEPFVTGLIRPVDVTLAPDGSLVVADFIYGHVWRVSYAGSEQ